jgi:hypothetical protein
MRQATLYGRLAFLRTKEIFAHLAKKPLEDKALGDEEGGDGQHEDEEAVEEDRLEDSSIRLLSSHHLGPDKVFKN